jgi:23S rRNA pseudouridine1911/1915/1917 synthase
VQQELDIIYESKHWLAINKPSGMIVERNPFEQPTVEDLVWEYLEATQKRPYLGIVHRLDRVTSGVLLIAKRKSALRHLNQQFADRSVQKTYLAILAKAPANRSGTLEHWLEKDQKNKMARIFAQAGEKRQRAILRYEVLQEKGGLFLTKVLPETGRFHQIRAQLAAIGCPIVGDEKYGSTVDPAHRYIALHAHRLSCFNPENDQQVEIFAPMPPEKWWLLFQ